MPTTELGDNFTVYVTDSKSEPGLVHFTMINNDVAQLDRCSCKGFRYNGYCAHIDEAIRIGEHDD